MKKLYMKLKMNNRGATLSMAMIAIIFVTLLASTVMAVAMSNLALKRTEVMGKRSFYTAETAVDKLYSGMGGMALDKLNDAYVEEMGNLLTYDSTTGGMVKNGNDAMNQDMKQKFINKFLKELTGNSLTPANTYHGSAGDATVKNYLNSLLGINLADADAYNDAKIKVSSVGEVKANAIGSVASGYYVTIADVVINYAADGYFADITTDFKIVYPDITVNFNNENPLDFLEYCLIANVDLGVGSFNVSGAENVTSNILNNIYAGAELNISNSSVLNLGGDAKAVAHSNVNIYSGTNASRLNLASATLWTEGDILFQQNRSAGIASPAGGILISDAASSLYVGDDLEFRNQEGSLADIAGKYIGYGYGTTANQNSSVIMNARSCTLNMHVDTLEILGRAYVEAVSTGTTPATSTSNEYRTADSLSVKSTQQIYLVLDSLLGGYTNPMPVSETHDITAEIRANVTDESKFFAAGLLDGAEPVRMIEDGSKVYYYYNFNSSSYDSAAEAYLNAVLSGQLNGVDVSGSSSWRQVNAIWQRNIDKTFKKGGSVDVSYTTSRTLGPILTSGAPGVSNLAAGGLDPATANAISTSYMHRIGGKASATCDLARMYGVQMADKNAYNAIINDSTAKRDSVKRVENAKVENGTAGTYEYPEYVEVGGVRYYLYVTKTADLSLSNIKTLDNSASIGNNAIIIHAGTGVFQVDKDFNGLIISAGTINVTKNATVTTNSAQVKEVLESTPSFAQFFKAYRAGSGDEDSGISSLSYEDFVSVMNWRKFEDPAITTP